MNDPQKSDETYLDWLERQAMKGGDLILDCDEALEGVEEIRALFLKIRKDSQFFREGLDNGI